MPRCKNTGVLLCALSFAAVAFISTAGCGNKEEAPPNNPGYYTGPLKGKSIKGASDTIGTNPTPGGTK